LYIFFLYLVLFFIKFSTISYADNVHRISNLEISDKFDKNFDKNKTINKAFEKAFNLLVERITLSSDKEKLNKVNNFEIKNLIDSFAIIDEKFIDNKYIATLDVEFDKANVSNLLEKNNIFPSIPIIKKLFVMPILLNNDNNKISLFSENPFFLNWNNKKEKYYLIDYILPNEDIEDINLIQKKRDELEKYNFEEIIKKYDLNDYIIIIFFKNNTQLSVLSKIFLNKEYKILNAKFINIDINNLNAVEEVIENLKINYEDEWKKINQINSSINLTITLALDNKKYDLIKKFEKKIKSMDLIPNYFIERFSEKSTIYKVVFNGTPDKFINELVTDGFNLETTSSIWIVQ
tara:strand:+ start:2687 stop:3730 length:1044 start_codon:yes stop_codon:yes gene_type:complete